MSMDFAVDVNINVVEDDLICDTIDLDLGNFVNVMVPDQS